MFALTNKTPSQITTLIDNISVVDPLSVLAYNKKNYNDKAIKNIFDNYSNLQYFAPTINNFGISSRFAVASHSPLWADYVYDTDWYWKQSWIRSFGQFFLFFPSVKKVYLGCSVALQMSHNGSDVDLIIETTPHCVWATKVYFAILSKVVKYYNFNFLLWVYFKIRNDTQAITKLKYQNLDHKIKIDFGLVYTNKNQNQKIVQNTEIWQEFYKDKERNLFIWRRLEIVQDYVDILDISKNNPKNGIIVVNKIFNSFGFELIKGLLFFLFSIFFIIGLIAYLYQRRINKHNVNMVVQWNIYSQYNLIY